VIDAGARLGVDVRPHRFPEGTHTAEDAARAIGCRLAQIVKTLVFVDAVGEPLVFFVSGANRLDASKGAAVAGTSGLRQADARTIKDKTGFSIGGVPPFGHAHLIPMFIDEALLSFDEIWAAGSPMRCSRILLGDGERLLENVGDLKLEQVRAIEAPALLPSSTA